LQATSGFTVAWIGESVKESTEKGGEFVRFEVFMMVKIQVEVLWIVMPCNVAIGYQRFGVPCCLHLQGDGDSMVL